jgi:hypothetical protein
LALPGNQSTSIVFAPGGNNASTGGVGIAPAIQPYYFLNPTLAQVNALTTVNGVPVPTAGFSGGYAQFFNPNGAACPVVNAAIGCFITTPYSFRDLRRFNFGKLQARGWDFAVNYAQTTDWGSFEGGISGTDYTLNRNVTTLISDQLAANFSPYQFTAYVGGSYGPLSARLTIQDSAGYTATGLGAQTSVDDFMVVNLNAGYDLDGLFPGGLRLLASPSAVTPVAALIRESVEERTLVAVGPEGGWNDFETGLLEAGGFRSAGMGARTLRTDTACVALLALVHDAIKARG